jgi:hypothetical protein
MSTEMMLCYRTFTIGKYKKRRVNQPFNNGIIPPIGSIVKLEYLYKDDHVVFDKDIAYIFITRYENIEVEICLKLREVE